MSVDTISEDQIKEIMESQSFADTFDVERQLYLPYTSEKDGSVCVGPGIEVNSAGVVRIGTRYYDAYDGLTREQCDEFVKNKLIQSRGTAREVIGKHCGIEKFDSIPRYRQDILTGCIYKLGKEKLVQFKKFIPALADGIFEPYSFWKSRCVDPLGFDGQTSASRTVRLKLRSEVFAGGKHGLKKRLLGENIQSGNLRAQGETRAACAVDPTKSSVRHSVKLSETMSHIGAIYGVTVDQIMRANPQIRHPSLIYPGIVLNIRMGSATAAKSG